MSIDGQILSYHQLIWWWDSWSVMTPVLVSHKQHLYLAVCVFFRKSSLYSKLASQLSRGVLHDISCTNCDNGSSHCHIVSPAPGTWSRTVTSHEWRNVQCPEGGEWLLCLCLRSKTQAGAHWPLVTVPTQCTGETQETRAPGHERDAALVIIETPATGSLSLSCNIKCWSYPHHTTSPTRKAERTDDLRYPIIITVRRQVNTCHAHGYTNI